MDVSQTTAAFEDIVTNPDQLVGVKAIWGPIRARVQCFAGRGDMARNPNRYFMVARSAAERAVSRPYLVTLGGGERVLPEYEGRAIEVMRLTGVYGQTTAFVTDPEMLEDLAQWPIAIV